MEKEIDLTVVIPCLNEAQTIGICVDKCLQVFKDLNISGEVIVSDNGSLDSSVQTAEEHSAIVVKCSSKGYGNAIRLGLSQAKGKWILIGDADNTYDFLEIPLFWNEKNENVDMIIGTRLKGKIEKGAMPFKNRYIGTPALTFILNFLYGSRISDSQCGMRLIKKSSLQQINLVTQGMEFASELLVQFIKHKFIIKEIPISLYKNIKGRKPHLRPFHDGLRHLIYLIKELFC